LSDTTHSWRPGLGNVQEVHVPGNRVSAGKFMDESVITGNFNTALFPAPWRELADGTLQRSRSAEAPPESARGHDPRAASPKHDTRRVSTTSWSVLARGIARSSPSCPAR
jgi:hypothetical protein